MEPGEIGKESGMALSFRWGDTAQPPLSQGTPETGNQLPWVALASCTYDRGDIPFHLEHKQEMRMPTVS